MGWGHELAFRDCPWCGLRDAQMIPVVTDAVATPPRVTSRVWSMVTCPRCGGAILLETNPLNHMPAMVERAVPEDGHAGQEVRHLPTEVARFYGDAQRVLDANVPDAAAVALRKTLEAGVLIGW
jgi:hypothetical protein